MKHTLVLNGVVIGHSELEHVDSSLRRAWGAFHAESGYDLVQPIFQLFADAQPRGGQKDEAKAERYYKARDALPLELQDANGRRIRTSAIHIADYSPSVELDVLIPEEKYWKKRAAEATRRGSDR